MVLTYLPAEMLHRLQLSSRFLVRNVKHSLTESVLHLYIAVKPNRTDYCAGWEVWFNIVQACINIKTN